MLAEQQLGGPGAQAVLAALQQVARDRVGHLVEEQRRHRHRPGREEALQVAVLERPGGDQAVAEGEHYLIVLARVGVGQRGQPLSRDPFARVDHQGLVQPALGGAGFGYRLQLGAAEIRAQEIIGDREMPARIPPQQVKAGIAPEIGHVRFYIGRCRPLSSAPMGPGAGCRPPTA